MNALFVCRGERNFLTFFVTFFKIPLDRLDFIRYNFDTTLKFLFFYNYKT